MSVQQEVLLWTKDESGEKVPYLCDRCGRQRIGVVLNIATKTMLQCCPERHAAKFPVQKMDWDLSDV